MNFLILKFILMSEQVFQKIKRASIRDEKAILRDMIKDGDEAALGKYCLVRMAVNNKKNGVRYMVDVSRARRNFQRFLKLIKAQNEQ